MKMIVNNVQSPPRTSSIWNTVYHVDLHGYTQLAIELLVKYNDIDETSLGYR